MDSENWDSSLYIRVFNNKHYDIDNIVQIINSMLKNADERLLGVQLLNKSLKFFSDQVLLQQINTWSLFLFKACNSKELYLYGNVVYDTLKKLCIVSQNTQNLKISFANNLLKIYDIISLAPDFCRLAALDCVYTCLKTYSVSNLNVKLLINKFLTQFIDTCNNDLSYYSGKCYYLLHMSSSGSKLVNQLQNYQLKIIDSIHCILNKIFCQSDELYDKRDTGFLEFPFLELSSDSVRRNTQLFMRFRNLTNYLIAYIREPYQGPKSICVKKILDLIESTFCVSSAVGKKQSVYDNNLFQMLLPKIRYKMLGILEVLMLTLRERLRSYHQHVLRLLISILKCAYVRDIHIFNNTNIKLRCKMYETISIWYTILQHGNCMETVDEHVIQEIFNDTQIGFQFKVQNVFTDQLEQQVFTSKRREPYYNSSLTETSYQQLFVSALRCLQEILISSICWKEAIIQFIRNTVVERCIYTYEPSSEYPYFLAFPIFRYELFSVLNLLMAVPPLTEISPYVLHLGYLYDNNLDVRRHCRNIMLNLEKEAHPKKDGLLLPIEQRMISKTFYQLVQQRSLNELEENKFANLLKTASEKKKSELSAEMIVIENDSCDLPKTEQCSSQLFDNLQENVSNAICQIKAKDSILHPSIEASSCCFIKPDKFVLTDIESAFVDELN